MPYLRTSSATLMPALASRRIEMIFSSPNRDFCVRALRWESSTSKRSSESGGYRVPARLLQAMLRAAFEAFPCSLSQIADW